jgi:hypothetical protein
MRITGRSGSRSRTTRSTSVPSTPGILMSLTTASNVSLPSTWPMPTPLDRRTTVKPARSSTRE